MSFDLDFNQIHNIVQRLIEIEEFDPLHWNSLEHDAKIKALNLAVSAIAEEMHLPKPTLEVIANNDVALQGLYVDKSNTFVYNELSLKNGVSSWYHNPLAVLQTTVHELRHAFQRFAVRDLDSGRIASPVVETWKENFAGNNYKTVRKDGRIAYENQPVEVDARQYAVRVVALLNEARGQK